MSVRGSTPVLTGDAALHPMLQVAVQAYALTTEPYIRVVFGAKAVLVQREGDSVFAVCFPVGHVIAKSVHRLIRREAQRQRRANRGVLEADHV